MHEVSIRSGPCHSCAEVRVVEASATDHIYPRQYPFRFLRYILLKPLDKYRSYGIRKTEYRMRYEACTVIGCLLEDVRHFIIIESGNNGTYHHTDRNPCFCHLLHRFVLHLYCRSSRLESTA